MGGFCYPTLAVVDPILLLFSEVANDVTVWF